MIINKESHIHQHQENNKQMFQLLPEKSIRFPFLSLHRVHGNCHFLSNLFLGKTCHTQFHHTPSFLWQLTYGSYNLPVDFFFNHHVQNRLRIVLQSRIDLFIHPMLA